MKRNKKMKKNGNRHGNFDQSIKTKIISSATSSRVNSHEERNLTIPEEFMQTKLGEIISR